MENTTFSMEARSGEKPPCIYFVCKSIGCNYHAEQATLLPELPKLCVGDGVNV